MKVWARNTFVFATSALFLSVVSIQAHAGITGSDPRPPRSGVVANISDGELLLPQNRIMLAGITGSDPRPPRSGVVVAGITGSDPRPPRSGVVVAGITGSDPRPPRSGVQSVVA
jgi:hypothetical protein